MNHKFQLDKDFILGAALSAYQAEGSPNTDGRGPCYWDAYLSKENTGFDGSVASDFYKRYPQDVKLCSDFGVNALRISISWSRILPDGTGKINQAGINYYHQLIDACLENNVEPFVTLHHFDTPLTLHKQGDWLNRDTIDYFVRFAKVCFTEYGTKVKKWITINEPWSVAAGQYIIGHFPPNIKYDIPKAIDALHNMMCAHAKVVLLYRSLNLIGEIGIVHILESKYPIVDSEKNRIAVQNEDVLANQFLLEATFNGFYSKKTLNVINKILDAYDRTFVFDEHDIRDLSKAAKELDFLGLNYYASHFIKAYDGDNEINHNGTGKKNSSQYRLKGIGERVINKNIPSTDWDWPIYPIGLKDMIERINNDFRNSKTIYVTENGLGSPDKLIKGVVDDQQRIDYIEQHLAVIDQCMKQGINIRGYFVWSLFDVLSWTNGYNKRYGLFYVDFKNQTRYPKKSAYWWKKMSLSRLNHNG